MKIALRSLWRTKVDTSINVFGLSLGIACCVLIILFVRDEWTFDAFHAKSDRIYRAYVKEDWGDNQQFFNTVTPFPLAPTLKENFEDVEFAVRISELRRQIKLHDKLFTEQITVAGPDFFKVFDFRVVKGSEDGLKESAAVYLTEQMAKNLFGSDDPIDKPIAIQLGENFDEFVVRGIVANPPVNSSIRFSVLVSDLNYKNLYDEKMLTSGWFNIIPETYVLLRSGANADALQSQFPPVFKSLLGDSYDKSKYFVGLQPLRSIHLDTSFPAGIAPVSNPRYAYILAAVALLILIVACINFVTLSVGRSLKRSKEVGIRKVAGAMRRQLIFQFVSEAVLVTLFALTVGFVLAAINLPLFNELSGKQLRIPLNSFTISVAGALVIVIGIFAGSYPAFFLSGFQPAGILKGSGGSGSGKQGLRRMLVGVQLVLSIFLISSTLLMQKQLHFLQNKDLGFQKEQLVIIPINVGNGGRLRERVSKGFDKGRSLMMEMSKIKNVSSLCISSHSFGEGAWMNLGFTDDQGVYQTFYYNTIDENTIPSLGLTLITGRNFSIDNPSDQKRSLIINEAFARAMNWDDPIGKKLPGKKFEDNEVIGVVKDFNYASLYTKVQPLVMAMDPSVVFSGIENVSIDNSPIPRVIARIAPGNIKVTLEEIKRVYEKFTGGEEFSFSFVDEVLNDQYRNDQNLGKIIKIASLLAILIGSMGLYALASLAMQNRTKEISIRKVLGASEGSLLVLLSKEYAVMVLVALLVSVPITVYLVKEWLASFEYRISIDVTVFILAGAIAIAIAILTVSYHAIKTAWVQPVKSLKYE
jgi:putative ABC transport system permease protein